MSYQRVRFQSRVSRGEELYTASLILTERHQKEREEWIEPEKLTLWRPVVRVNEMVVKRRGGGR